MRPYGQPLEVVDAAGGQPWAVAGGAGAGELEEADDAGALAAVWLEELEHALVRTAGLAGEGPADHVRDVEVADADRVWVPERTEADLGRGPRADARDRSQRGVRRRQRRPACGPGRG